MSAPHAPLETERLLLRRFTPADLDNLVELDSDPAVMRFLSGGAATPRAVVERDILPRFLHASEHSAGFGYWAAVEKSNGDFLGWFSFRPRAHDGPNAATDESAPDAAKKAGGHDAAKDEGAPDAATDEGCSDAVELGYRLRRAAWGRGYATEGARALIRRGFVELGVRRVVATTYQDNLASRRVMEKAGLTLVRSYRLTPADLAAEHTYLVTSQEPWDGDDVEYALTRADWARLAAAAAPGSASPARRPSA